MASDLQRGYLIIADISGYTAFLTGTALEHAHGILSQLIQSILDTCNPPIELVELEGDAVYAYLPAEKAEGRALLEDVERTYFAFAARRDAMERGLSCTCEACSAVPKLDLKFVVHYGEFLLQRLAGRSKPIGPDVILVHRLLKNHIAETFGWRAYLFMTRAASDRLTPGGALLGLQPHSEEYEHLGMVDGGVLDLATRWERESAGRARRLDGRTAHLTHSLVVPARPPVVWDYLTLPALRGRWETSPAMDALRADAHNASDHTGGGEQESILAWRPPEYFTTQTVAAAPLRPPIVRTTALEPEGAGTRVTWYVAPAEGWRARCGLWLGRGRLARTLGEDGARLQALIASEAPGTEGIAPQEIESAVAFALANPEPVA